MSVVTDILDALRRFGRRSEKNALRRQDDYLSNKVVLDRRKQGDYFAATVEPVPENVEALTGVEDQAILENAGLITQFMTQFGVSVDGQWSIDDLDAVFTTWSASTEKHGYSDEAVVQITGAAFGQLCVERLNMR